MQLHLDANLKPYHTFAIDQSCRSLVVIESVQDLISVYQSEQWRHTPKLMLGKGSNILFTAIYQGLVMVNRIAGIEHSEDNDFDYLHVSGGEDWPALVAWCMTQKLYGLENLALIPGCAGSAPIQNIGAYGVEFKDVCDYVDYLCLDTLSVKRLSAEECLFGYRDSIFKHRLYDKAIVVAVGLKLAKNWQPVSSYGPLKVLAQPCSAEAIYQCVCQTRLDKLPDPTLVGNAGSFFKNPVISHEEYQRLVAEFPDIVAYPVSDGMKIAAGWLIDSAGLKGRTQGGAQVHSKQALVLINADGASAQDVINLAAVVRQSVQDKYGITLEHEVRFIGVQGETNLTEILEQA